MQIARRNKFPHSGKMTAESPVDATTAADRILALFEAIVKDNGATAFLTVASGLGIPSSTAHRMLQLLLKRGMVAPASRGRYMGGMTFVDMAQRSDHDRVLATIARPYMKALVRRTRTTTHLGVLTDDMVTYLVKEGRRAAHFAREGDRLEAYCSGVGKILLANLPASELRAYLADGPFVALTPNTLIDPLEIRKALMHIGRSGFALDEEEVAEGLFCVAVPIRRADGQVVAALSLSRQFVGGDLEALLTELRLCSSQIEARLDVRPAEPAAAMRSSCG